PEHASAAAMNGVRDALRSWEKPALVAWGADDAVLPISVAERIVELIPGATGPVLIEDASHFLQEDAPDEVAAAVLRFLG
ncbi:MAG TPA: alpha/beta fold hydrolase, partial [Gaiellaceae bacterium]|nr:alpha/beta fold hydrolase [Gaiellaceae bacterium]